MLSTFCSVTSVFLYYTDYLLHRDQSGLHNFDYLLHIDQYVSE